ncbi:MAG: protease inhibitor I42 family protein [Candidatus Acidiferrum sp.]
MSVTNRIRTMGHLILALGLWCAACTQRPKMIQADKSFDGRDLTMNVGDTVELSLAENPTTGFRWDFASKPEPVCTIAKDAFDAETGSLGKGGTHHWEFQAVRAGTGTVKLEYRRPWEKDTPAADKFSLTLRVK